MKQFKCVQKNAKKVLSIVVAFAIVSVVFLMGSTKSHAISTVVEGEQKAVSSNLSKPHTAWKKTSAIYYSYISSDIPYKIRLEEFYNGAEAFSIIEKENHYNDDPTSNQQWYLMKFYLENNGDEELEAKDVVFKSDFYTRTGASLVVAGTASFSGERRGMGIFDIRLQPGASGYFWIGILGQADVDYPYLRLSNGYDSANRKALYTWLDTKPVIATPKVTVKQSSNGVEVSWDAVELASKYRVFKKNSEGKWTALATVNALKYTDKSPAYGDPNTYTVCVVDSNGKVVTEYGSGKSITLTKDPIELTLKNKNAGVAISWGSEEGASKYRVFRKKSGGSWEKLATTSSLNYTDKNVVYSETYLYSVRAMTAKGNFINKYGNGTKIKYLISGPKVTLSNNEKGIEVTWKTLSKAAKYRIYQKNEFGKWTKISDVKSGTTYTDTATVEGISYTYTVVGLDSAGREMNDKAKTTTIVRNNNFIKITCTNTTSGVELHWDEFAGAEKYRVYKKNASGNWSKIATVEDISYIDADATPNATNTYAVRAVALDGTVINECGNGKSIKFVIPPTSLMACSKASGVRLDWDSVVKTEKYQIYRKTKSTDWAKIGTTSGLSYTDKSAESGKTYFYSVIALDAKGKAINDYGEGTKIKYVSPKSDALETEDLFLEGFGIEVNDIEEEIAIEEEESDEDEVVSEDEISEEDTADETTDEDALNEDENKDDNEEDSESDVDEEVIDENQENPDGSEIEAVTEESDSEEKTDDSDSIVSSEETVDNTSLEETDVLSDNNAEIEENAEM